MRRRGFVLPFRWEPSPMTEYQLWLICWTAAWERVGYQAFLATVRR